MRTFECFTRQEAAGNAEAVFEEYNKTAELLLKELLVYIENV